MKHKPSEVARKMWYETAVHYSIPVLKASIEILGAENILLGTDFPYIGVGDGQFYKNTQFIKEVISTRDAKKILNTNGTSIIEACFAK
jgi:hypothetical protein